MEYEWSCLGVKLWHSTHHAQHNPPKQACKLQNNMQSVSTFISLRTSTGIDCKNAYSSGPTIDSGNLRLKWCHSLVHAEPQTRQVPMPVPQNAPLATIHHRGPISRAATMCWKATSYSSDKITGIQPQCMLSLVERKTPQWPSTLQLNDTGHVRAEHQLLDPGLLLQSCSFYCSWFTCCKMMQNGSKWSPYTNALLKTRRAGSSRAMCQQESGRSESGPSPRSSLV
jgi:hypothetical protein